jgi:CPA1 family monovalent cation:H+ antiporter
MSDDDVEICTHLIEAEGPAPRMTTPGCATCLSIGQSWVHLRQCLTCGVVLCCDDSIGRHATGHFLTVGHPTMRSAEPEDAWRWCFVDEIAVEELPDERPPA